MVASRSDNEPDRLAALQRYGILDTGAEAAFDDLALLAARICGAPVALVSLIDADRQWFKARVGCEVKETPRETAFCAHAIRGRELLVVPDALADPRFATNPMVTGDPHVRFYAGAPLLTPDGHALGTLCVLDRVPRELGPEQRQALEILSRRVVAELELRRTSAALAERARLHEAAEKELRKARDELEHRVEEGLKKRTEQVIRHHAALLELARTDLSDWQAALRLITETSAETMGVARVGVWLSNDDASEMRCESVYTASSRLHQEGMRIRAADYPRYFQALDEARVLAAHDVGTDPRTRELAAEYLEPAGITSMMDNPVHLHGKLVGIVCHEHIGPARKWTVEEQEFGASIADMVALALEAAQRHRAEAELRARRDDPH